MDREIITTTEIRQAIMRIKTKKAGVRITGKQNV